MAFITYFLARADVLVYFSIFISLFIYWINGIRKRTAKMPPGPMPLPVIGNLHLVDLERPHESLMQLSKKYGEIFTLNFGPKKMVILAGYKIIKEALVTQAEDFGDRPITPVFEIVSNGHGIILSNGEIWKSMRRFTISTLRDFGMGKKSVESRIQDELMPLIDSIKSHNGKPFNIHLLINSAVSNVICSIIFGKRFEYDDPTFQKLIKMLDEIPKLVGTPKVMESTKAQTHFNEENLLTCVLDLFGAGTETTSTTIRWGILLLMKYPEIQKRVQEEIKTHIKPGQLPTVEDRKKMPYTDAVIHEIQRFGNIIPLNLPHSTPTDVYLRGYLIPKGTEVIPLLTSVLYDKTQWKTPYVFNPNHFLDENGKFVRHDAFIPFSLGRRACAGEALAKMELFLFFTGLLQAFTFYPPPGVSREDLNLKPGVGFTLVPTPYMTCAKPNY
ncbi:cytochrome P450 2K4-like isoform X2 [Phyllobates terribilis]|uniref:cytochrome P450 2K4-like isoform X2 n=1 Tax=Phyllobates terribilis TaxID=111132 RepID=UPI003CCAD3AB